MTFVSGAVCVGGSACVYYGVGDVIWARKTILTLECACVHHGCG